MPRRSASQMWNRRWSSVRATPFLISASVCFWMRGAIMLSSLISQPRTAFISAPLEAVVDGHDLAGRLHLGAEGVVGINELIERPARELDDAVVERRLKARLGLAGNGVRDFVQTVADRDFRGDLCNRVAGRLGSQRGGTGTRGFTSMTAYSKDSVERVLHVAATLDAQLGDDVERGGAEHLILLVAQGLRRRNNDRVAGVDADRVNVLHVTDGDGVALVVAHDLELDLLPAGDALLDQNFVNARVHDAEAAISRSCSQV